MELLMQMSDRCAELSVALKKKFLDVPLGCDDNLFTAFLFVRRGADVSLVKMKDRELL